MNFDLHSDAKVPAMPMRLPRDSFRDTDAARSGLSAPDVILRPYRIRGHTRFGSGLLN